ncbi:MAG: ABC transporter substrate-binding protein [Chloroflexota bacterium]
MKRTNQLFALLLLLGLLSACVAVEPAAEAGEEATASESTGDESADTSEDSSMAANVDTSDLIPDVQVEGFPTFAPAQPLMEVISRNDETVAIKHTYGETEIPANPQRIFVNDMATMQILLSIGVTPAGVASFLEELPAALQGKADGVELLIDATGEGVGIEALAALGPDLILGHGQFSPGQITEEQYELYSEIAPTVAFSGNPFFYWKESTLELAEFFGVPEKGVEVLTDYNNQIADFRAQAEEAVGDESVTILLLFDTTMWLYSVGGDMGAGYTPLSVTTWAYRELGLTPGPEVAGLAGEELWAEVSLELIPELKGDHMVVFPNAYGGDEIGSGLDDYLDSPLWQTVPAVASGNVHQLTANNSIEGYWTTPYLIEQFINELAK